MTFKININDQARGFYFAASGNDDWDGKSLETPKQGIQVAIDATQTLIPLPSPTNLAQVSEAQGGLYIESGLTLYDGVIFEATTSSIITSDPVGVEAANGLSFRPQAIVNATPGAVLLNIDSITQFGAVISSVNVGGDGGVGFNITGNCDQIFLTASQLLLNADNAIVWLL